MTATSRTPSIRRILIALDSCSHDPAALESVVLLAARLHAELAGLLVEDVDLLRSVAFPFVRQVTTLTGASEEIDTTSTERQLRVRAQRAKRCLQLAAERRKVKWSFRTVRGRLDEEIASAAEDADLLVVEKAIRPSAADLHGAGPIRSAASQVRRSLLYMKHRRLLDRPTLLASEDGEQADRALEIAASLSGGEFGPLDVLALAGTSERQTALVHKLRGQLQQLGVEARMSSLFPSDLAALKALLHALGSGVLIVGAGCPVLKSKTPEVLADYLDRPFLLIR
jgi:hypothetical protein